MGRDLCDRWPEAREVFARADEALGEPISQLCFDGPEDQLQLTKNTQPALVTASIAAWTVLRRAAPEAPSVAAGHSLGEYSALVASGVLKFEDAVRAVRFRGEAMQSAVPVGTGAMAAVIGLDADGVEALCGSARDGDEILVPANYNGPDQIVVAGHKAAVDRLVATAAEHGAKRAIPLNVSAPFHCPLMSPAAEALASHLMTIDFGDPEFPVLANVDVHAVASGEEARERLVSQVASPVRWVETMKSIECRYAPRAAMEIGPGRVLAGLSRRINESLRVSAAGSADAVESAIEKLSGEQQ